MGKRRKFWVWFIFLFLLLPFKPVVAQLDPEVLEGEDYLNELGRGTEVLEKRALIPLLFNILRYLLGFTGVIAVTVIIWAGYSWMTAAGNEEKVKKAKQTLQNGVIGLIVIMTAYVLIVFVIKSIRR